MLGNPGIESHIARGGLRVNWQFVVKKRRLPPAPAATGGNRLLLSGVAHQHPPIADIDQPQFFAVIDDHKVGL